MRFCGRGGGRDATELGFFRVGVQNADTESRRGMGRAGSVSGDRRPALRGAKGGQEGALGGAGDLVVCERTAMQSV